MYDELKSVFNDSESPVALLDGKFRAIWRNKAAENCEMLSDRALRTGIAERRSVLLQLKQRGGVTVPLAPFPGSERLCTVLPAGDGYLASISSTASMTTGTAGLLSGVDWYSASARSSVQKLFLKISTLAAAAETPEELRAAQELRRVGYGMLRSANNASMMARYICGALTPNKRPTNVSELVRSLCEAASGVMSSGVPLKCETEPEPLCFSTDSGLITQVLMNLLLNSYKYTSDYNEITVRLAAQGTSVVLTVSDRGTGIRPELIGSVTEPYFSSDPYNDGEPRPGLGLGLSVAAAAAKLLGGSLAVTSEFGEGTCVAVSIPIEGECAAQDVLRENTLRYVADRFSDIYVGLAELCDIPD